MSGYEAFDGEGYEACGGEKGKTYLLSFKVIAMGDLNAVDIVQQVHVEILKDYACMNPSECVEFREPQPASHTMERLYIDDHIVAQILPAKKFRPKSNKVRDVELITSMPSKESPPQRTSPSINVTSS